MVGQHVSIVVMTGESKHVVWGSNQLLSAKIQARGDQLVALHCWKVDEVTDDLVVMSDDASSIVVPIPPPEAADFCRVSEVCSGIGGTLHGAVSCGMKPLVALDCTDLSSKLLRLNGLPVVVQGDLNVPSTLARFHLAHVSSRFGLLAGFPCQPFGTLGGALAFLDPRAHTFFAILDLAWLVQCSFLLLECVVGAGQNPTVCSTIELFCRKRGFRWVPVVLHLDYAFPAFRTRWWCLMYPAWLPALEIPDLPVTPWTSLERIFPFWPCWSPEEEWDLKLDE